MIHNPKKFKLINKNDGTAIDLVDVIEGYCLASHLDFELIEVADGNTGMNFNKCLCNSRTTAKDGKEYVNFYLVMSPNSKAVQIKLAFWDKATFKFLLANSDNVKAYTKKETSVFIPSDNAEAGEDAPSSAAK